MNLNIKTGTAGYNNKILVPDEKFSLGKNEKINSLETPAMKSHKYTKTNSLELAQKPNVSHKKTGTHSQRGKNCSGTFLASGFAIWNMFR